MYYKTTKTLAAAALITLAFGCKREALTENPRPVSLPTGSAPTVTHLQQWVKNHPLSLSAQGRTAGNNLPKHTLLWGQASYDAAGHAYTVPLLLAHEGAAQSKLRAALVATEGADGQITDGQYMLTLPQGNAPAQYPKQGQEAPGYSGAVLYYNMQGQLTAGKVYKDGRVLPNAKAMLLGKGGKPQQAAAAKGSAVAAQPKGGADQRPPKTCDVPQVCIDWYWQTYVDGVLVNEEYLYTTCYCPNDGAGSGGGTGGPVEDDETQQMIDKFNQETQAVITPATAMAPPSSPDPEPISITHTWTVAEGLLGTWKVTATTRMDYYHDTYYNMLNSSIEHKFRIVYLKTLNTGLTTNFNLAINTTWTESLNSPVDNKYNNNTADAFGKSQVLGNVKHVLGVTLPIIGEVNAPLTREYSIDNYCITHTR